MRLGNTDSKLIGKFIEFLVRFFSVDKGDMQFGLQIFSDIEPSKAMEFWISELGIKSDQLFKPTITKSGSIGTYKKKSEFGVLQILYHNKKLRDLLISKLPM